MRRNNPHFDVKKPETLAKSEMPWRAHDVELHSQWRAELTARVPLQHDRPDAVPGLPMREQFVDDFGRTLGLAIRRSGLRGVRQPFDSVQRG